MWFCCVLAGILSDLFIKKKFLSTLNTRKLFNSTGNYAAIFSNDENIFIKIFFVIIKA